jgi:hypothetical protein
VVPCSWNLTHTGFDISIFYSKQRTGNTNFIVWFDPTWAQSHDLPHLIWTCKPLPGLTTLSKHRTSLLDYKDPIKCVGPVQNRPHHFIECKLFSWYSFKIAYLALNDNHSFTKTAKWTIVIIRHHISIFFEATGPIGTKIG